MRHRSTSCINVFALDNGYSVILENVGGLHSYSLAHIPNVDNTDDAEKLNIIKHSSYFDQEFYKNIK